MSWWPPAGGTRSCSSCRRRVTGEVAGRLALLTRRPAERGARHADTGTEVAHCETVGLLYGCSCCGGGMLYAEAALKRARLVSWRLLRTFWMLVIVLCNAAVAASDTDFSSNPSGSAPSGMEIVSTKWITQ